MPESLPCDHGDNPPEPGSKPEDDLKSGVGQNCSFQPIFRAQIQGKWMFISRKQTIVQLMKRHQALKPNGIFG